MCGTCVDVAAEELRLETQPLGQLKSDSAARAGFAARRRRHHSLVQLQERIRRVADAKSVRDALALPCRRYRQHHVGFGGHRSEKRIAMDIEIEFSERAHAFIGTGAAVQKTGSEGQKSCHGVQALST